MATRRLKHWGWGYEDQAPSEAALREAAAGIQERFGFGGEPEVAVPLDQVEVAKPRIKAPEEIGDLFTDDPYERVSRALGKAYRDVVRGFRGQFDSIPDLVARPRTEADVSVALEWSEAAGAAVVPFGGGTGVVGGVEARGEERPVVTLDLRGMDRVREIDETSLAARIEAGATGPRLEEQLRERGLTMRFFPQSFEYSTLGGWIATRAGGHFATGPTHVDDLVESVRALTPKGPWESRRLPASGAGPSPDRLLLGSEGTLGVVTEAWVRVRPRPQWRASVAVAFDDFGAGAAAIRAVLQAGLEPSNCRLVEAGEAELTGAGDGSAHLLLLGFESAHAPVDAALDAAVAIAHDAGGAPLSTGRNPAHTEGNRPTNADHAGAVETWRGAFFAAPYIRDTFVACGVLSETFESAVIWDRFAELHASVLETARAAVAEVSGAPAEGPGSPHVSCRTTHAYSDGIAPYFTVLGPAIRGGEVEQWDEVKAAVSEAILAGGGTITHHHAVGRDHRPWYDRQRPDPFAAALRAAKAELDPAGTLNPGVLIDPA